MQIYKAHLRGIVATVLGKGAKVVEVDWLGDLELIISWQGIRSLRRNGKSSKSVHLTIEEGALVAYADASTQQRHIADSRLVTHLTECLSKFNPDDETPLGRPQRLERWLIGTSTLFQ